MIIYGRINVTEGGLAHFRMIGVNMELGQAKRNIKKQFALVDRKGLTFQRSKSERAHIRVMNAGNPTNFVLLEVRI